MAKFSAGQKIVCIDASDAWSELIVGEAYEVVRKGTYYEDNGYVAVSGVDSSWNEDRFTLYEEKEEIMSSKKVPNVHAEMIKAWADGEEIEYSFKNMDEWSSIDYPDWFECFKFRIKPEPTKTEPAYPKTTMHNKDIQKIYNAPVKHGIALDDIANEAIKHFIVSGDMNKYLESLK
jgi:hypothetical protein